MRRKSTIWTGWQGMMILAILVLTAGWPERAYCETDDPVLLLQQTPPQGGTITPETGVHHYDLNADVTLTAVPRPGYQFVYWLGEVSDPMTSSTIVCIDAPKIVIAIFERAEYEFLVAEERAQSAPIGGLVASGPDYSRGGFTGRGPRRPPKFRWPSLPEREEPNEFPAPEGGDDFPVPEPATAALLVLGGLLCLRRRRGRQMSLTGRAAC